MEKLDKKQLAILGASIAAAFAIGVAIPSGDSGRRDLPAVTVDGAPAARVEKLLEHKPSPMRAYRDQHPGTIDLVSPPVEPGAQVTTGVYAPRGSRISEVAPVAGTWTVDGTKFRDDTESTWLEVTATNTGNAASRFVAIVKVE